MRSMKRFAAIAALVLAGCSGGGSGGGAPAPLSDYTGVWKVTVRITVHTGPCRDSNTVQTDHFFSNGSRVLVQHADGSETTMNLLPGDPYFERKVSWAKYEQVGTVTLGETGTGGFHTADRFQADFNWAFEDQAVAGSYCDGVGHLDARRVSN